MPVASATAARAKMVVDLVDDGDRVVGRARRQTIMGGHAEANFRVVHVLVERRDGALLLQRIAPGHRHAGMWGASVAGFVKSGETYEAAAKRKVAAELGIAAAKVELRLLGKTQMNDFGVLKFITVFAMKHDGAVRLLPEESAGLEFLSVDEIDDALLHGTRELTPTFRLIVEFARSALPASAGSR